MTERILNQNGVENYGQNRYAESRVKNTMADGPVNNEGQPQKAQEGRKLEAPKKHEVQISKEEDKDQKIKQAVNKFSQDKVAEERGPQKVQTHQELVGPTRADTKKYMPDVVPGTMNNAVNEFYREFATQTGEPSTEFLVRHYLKLRDAAGLKSHEILANFRNELAKLGIEVKALDSYCDESVQIERDWRELEKAGRITAEDAERMIRARLRPMSGGQGRGPLQIDIPAGVPGEVRKEISALNAVLKAYGEQHGNEEALQKALEHIAKIEADLTGDEQVATGRVIDDISDHVRTLYEGRKQAHAKREKRGFYQERILTDDEVATVESTIDAVIRDPHITKETPMEQLLKALEPADKLFNRMFDRADANPHQDFEHAAGMAGNQEYTLWITMLNDFREKFTGDQDRQALVKKLIERYSAEHKLRELLHNAFFIAETGGEAKNFAGFTSQFQSEFADLAFLGAPEVEVAFRIREQVLYQIKRENNGTIPYEKVAYIPDKGWSEWERRSEGLLREANKARVFGDPLEGWKLERALSISRGMGVVLLRFPEIVAECPLRAASDQYEGQPSIPWETITWELNPLDHKIKRYDIGREMSAILYASLRRKKKGMWNQDELRDAYALKAIESMELFDEEGEERMIDMRNFSKIGGWATHSGWRSYVSALEEDQSKLRPLLEKNPGIAMRLLWNKYLINDLADEKKKFIASFRVENPGASDQDMLKAWEAKKIELGSQEENWKTADAATWKATAKRIPHVVLRIITDPNNRLLDEGQSKRLMQSIFGNLSGKELEAAYTQLETDLTLAKEHLMRRRREKGNNFTEAEDMLMDSDFDVIPEGVRRDRAKALFDIVTNEIGTNTELQNRIYQRVSSRGLPFAITNEDVPFSEYRFAQTGGRGLITRRNNDWFQEVEANNAVIDMIKHLNVYQSPEQLIEQLHKIHDLSEVHDRDRANDLIEYLAKGLIRFYQKDGVTKIPIIGELMQPFNAARHRGNSFAQTIYGGRAMDLEADDIWYFTENLRSILVGKDGLERIDRIRKETGGTLPMSILRKTKVAFYLLALFGSYEWAQSLLKEK